MKKLFILSICVLLTLSMVLSSCDFAALFDGEASETVTTSETPTTENTTPTENPQQGTPIKIEEERYNRALALLDEGKLEDAYTLFLSIKNYADVPTYLSHFVFKADENEYKSLYSHHSYRYQYDECGRVVRCDVTNLTTQNTTSYFYEYDENGCLIKQGSLYGENKAFVTMYEYDEKGRPILLKESSHMVSLEYDEQDRIVKRVSDSWGEKDTTLYTYDEEGFLTEQIFMSGDGRKWCKVTWEHNEYGDVIKRTEQEINDLLASPDNVETYVAVYIREYDENGNLTKITYQDGSYDAYEYDENGNKLQYTSYYGANDFIVFYYTYDENGNMTAYRRENAKGVTNYMYAIYDAYGNELERRDTIYDGDLTSLSIYKGYKLYYNPNPQKPLPEEMVGKG